MEKQLPKNWVIIPFTEIFDINGGTQPPKAVFIDEPRQGYIRLLQIRDFGSKPVPTYIPDTGKLMTCKKDDILIARYGASIGRIVTGMEGAYNVALAKVSIPKNIDKNFTKWLLKSNLFQEPILSIQRTAQNGFNKTDLASIFIPIPPLPEQHRIAAKLDTLFAQLDSMKKNLEQVPLLLKNFRQQVLTQAVTGKLTEEWREDRELGNIEILFDKITSYLSSKKKWKSVDLKSDSYLNIPSSWKKTFIGNISEISNGSTPSRKINEYWNGHIPWVGSGFIQNNRINYSDEYITDVGFKNSSLRLLPKGSVLLAMIGEGKTRAQSAILDIEGTINQNIAAIIIEHKLIIPEFLQYYLIANYEKHRDVGSGTGPQALNCQKVRELEFVLPSLEEQQEIVTRVESLFSKADAIEKQYESLKVKIDSLPQAILHKAFKGELTEQLDSDGDARELINEILELKKESARSKKK